MTQIFIRFSKWWASLFILILILLGNPITFAQRLSYQPEVQSFIRNMATKYRYSPSYIQQVLNQARYQPDVISNMEKPFEAVPWYKYQTFFITPQRVEDGIEFYGSYSKVLKLAQNYFGVSSGIITAILGIESRWGAEEGRFRVVDALSTLAFYYPSRGKYFQSELRDFFLLVKEKGLNPFTLYGSYAGAMGMPQFMPSSYLYYGYGFPNERRVDLFNSKQDAIFSIGNFLMQKGWERNQPITVRAHIVGSEYQNIIKKDHNRPTDPTLTLTELAKLGITPADHRSYSPYLKAYLIELIGQNGPEYWLAFHNFYVLTRYNQSDLYALTAFLLGNDIESGWLNRSGQKQAAKANKAEPAKQ